jgi:aminomethyltransferase
LPLHGHELGVDISALESGLGWIIKFDKGDFIGRSALLAQRDAGIKRKLVGFFLTEAGIARQGDVLAADDGASIGIVTSGTKTPTVQQALGMALVAREYAEVDKVLRCVVRGRSIAAKVVGLPFYKRVK